MQPADDEASSVEQKRDAMEEAPDASLTPNERIELERIKLELDIRKNETVQKRLDTEQNQRAKEIEAERERFRIEAESSDRQAQQRIFYGLVAIVSGLVVLAVLYTTSLFFFSTPEADPQQVANNIVASMGVVTGVIGSLVSAYFGIQLGSAGRERAESQRDRAIAKAPREVPPEQ
jgi:hypothetical protein